MLPGSMFQGLIDYYFTGSMMHGILNPYLLFTAPLFLYSSTPLAKKIASEKIPNISKKFNLWWAARSSKLQQVGNQELLNVLNSLSEWIIKSRGLREIVIIDRCPALTEEEIKLYLESLKQASKVDILVNLARMGADKKDCFIPFCEALDCNASKISPTTTTHSLTWLAAKAVSKADVKNNKRKRPIYVSDEVENIIDSTQKYAKIN